MKTLKAWQHLCLGYVTLAVITSCMPKRSSSAVTAELSPNDGCQDAHPVVPDYGDANQLRLVFCDSFSKPTLDGNKWVTNFGWGNITKPTGNEDREVNFDYDAYFDPQLVKIADSQLQLNAVNQANPAAVHGGQWTSSAVSGHFQFMYGYIEARIRAPDTHGMWPAFWITFPFRWPPEIDIMELRTNMTASGGYDYKLNVNYIYGPAWNDKRSQYLELSRSDLERVGLCERSEASCGKKFSEFHTYAVAWQPESLDYFINGRRVFRANIQDEPRGKMGALLMNLAVGGWAERPDARTDWSKARMDIDWVRIWEFPNSPTVLAFADPSIGSVASTPAPPVTPPSSSSTTNCPAGNDGSGAQWCDCAQPTKCLPWCIGATNGDWGYETGADGQARSCHAKPKP